MLHKKGGGGTRTEDWRIWVREPWRSEGEGEAGASRTRDDEERGRNSGERGSGTLGGVCTRRSRLA